MNKEDIKTRLIASRCNINNLFLKNKKLKEENERLQKALDKACEKLEDLEWSYGLFDLDYSESNLYHKGRTYSTKEEWKEYLLKEVKNNDTY